MFFDASRSEPRLGVFRHPAEHESPFATPTHGRGCQTARPLSAAPTTSVLNFLQTPTMHQLDPDGYPTRALYYLHKRMLDITLNPAQHLPNTRPGTPIASPLFTPPEESDPNNSFELDSVGDQALHDICATLFSADYTHPPSPPCGASPCVTPPRFDSPIKKGKHDEHACRIARMLVSYGVFDPDAEMMEELEVELECGAFEWTCPNSVGPAAEVGKSLLDEMVKTPCAVQGKMEDRKAKQARRRARNSLNGMRVQEIVV